MAVDSNDELRRVFHRLWTKAVGTPDYVKQEWKSLNVVIDAITAASSLEGTVYTACPLCKRPFASSENAAPIPMVRMVPTNDCPKHGGMLHKPTGCPDCWKVA